jgi:hypothetical protein
MTAFGTPTVAGVVIFASLGLVALSLALLARRYSASAFAIGLVGLLVLTTVSTWNTYARPETDVQDRREEREIQRPHERIQELEKRGEAREAENDQLRTSLAAAQSRLDEVDRLIAKQNRDLEAAHSERDDAKRERDVAIAELENKRQQSLLPLRQPEVPAIDRERVRRILENRLDTPFYTSQPLPQRALVAGLTGSWYVVRLKLGDKPLTFADGQFRMTEAVQGVKESAQELQDGMLALVRQASKNTRLFLRGGADPRALVRLAEPPDPREFLILPRQQDGNYARDPQRLLPATPVRNEDLPNLRADWLRQNIRSVLLTQGSAEIEILENPPAPGQERTADLILYVEW